MCFCVIFWLQPNQCGHTQLEELILLIFVNWNIGHNTINNGVCSFFINTGLYIGNALWNCSMFWWKILKYIQAYIKYI